MSDVINDDNFLVGDNEIGENDNCNSENSESNNSSDSSESDEEIVSNKVKKKIRKLKKKRKFLKKNIKSFKREFVDDVWYQSDFLNKNKYIPIIKGTEEYNFLIRLAIPHFNYIPKLIFKKHKGKQKDNDKDKIENSQSIEYTFFGDNCLPLKINLSKNKIPICEDLIILPMPDTEHYLFSDNLLKS